MDGSLVFPIVAGWVGWFAGALGQVELPARSVVNFVGGLVAAPLAGTAF